MLHKLRVYFALALFILAAYHLANSQQRELPKPTDHISVTEHVLSAPAIQKVDRICARLDHSSTDTQVAVVTIESLNGADIAKFATDLANSWGVGSKETYRGVLVLLAIKDHKWRIAVGRGLESILSNTKAEEIGARMIPRLRVNDFDDAVLLAVQDIAKAVSRESPGKPL